MKFSGTIRSPGQGIESNCNSTVWVGRSKLSADGGRLGWSAGCYEIRHSQSTWKTTLRHPYGFGMGASLGYDCGVCMRFGFSVLGWDLLGVVAQSSRFGDSFRHACYPGGIGHKGCETPRKVTTVLPSC